MLVSVTGKEVQNFLFKHNCKSLSIHESGVKNTTIDSHCQPEEIPHLSYKS